VPFSFVFPFADVWDRHVSLTPSHRLPPFLPFGRAGTAPGRTGWDVAPPGRPARRATGALSWARSSWGGGFYLFTPRRTTLGHGLCGRGGCTSPVLAVDPGATEGICTALRVAVLQMLGRDRNPSRRATNPVGVFFPLNPCARRERRRRRARRHHTAPAGPRAGRVKGDRAEGGRRRGHLPRLREPLHRAGHDYTAAPS
jgi:hypothetical protein